jgi:hypothetical protein
MKQLIEACSKEFSLIDPHNEISSLISKSSDNILDCLSKNLSKVHYDNASTKMMNMLESLLNNNTPSSPRIQMEYY